MKNFIGLFFFLLVCITHIPAQDWNSLTNGRSTFYVLDQSDTLVWNYTARFDTVINGDSVFSLPPYYEICRSCDQYMGNGCGNILDTVYFKVPARFFPGKAVKKNTSGDWIFETSHFLLKNTNTFHLSWLADTTAGITCEVDTIIAMPVLGQQDSVRIYRLSSNDSILVGKYSGLISFPEGTSGHQLQIAGHREDRRGKYLPSHREIYDWQPGDIFYYLEQHDNGWAQFPCDLEIEEKKIRYDVLQDHSTTQQWIYEVLVTSHSRTYCAQGTGNSSVSHAQHTVNMVFDKETAFGDVWWDSASHGIQAYWQMLQNWSDPYQVVRSFPVSWHGINGIAQHNQSQVFFPEFRVDLTDTTYFLENHSNATACVNQDSLYRSLYEPLTGMWFSLEGIGDLWRDVALSFDIRFDRELKGYIKNGISYGVIPSFSELLALEHEGFKDIRVYSASENIYLEDVSENILPMELSLMDMSGKMVAKKQVFSHGIIFSTIGLSPGMYIVQGYSENRMLTPVKIMVN